MTRSPYWEPFAQSVLDLARSAGPAGFTVDDVPGANQTPPQVRGSVLAAMTFEGFIISIGRERSRRPERKSAKVDRFVLAEPEDAMPESKPYADNVGSVCLTDPSRWEGSP